MNSAFGKIGRMIGLAIQWGVFVGLALITLAMAFMTNEMQVAGVSPVAFFIALGAFGAVTLVLFPPIFFKLPKRAKITGYLALLPVFIAVIAAHGFMDAAYLKTPEGKAAAEKAEVEAATEFQRVRENEDRKASEALFEEHRASVAEMHRRVERCLNWRGQIPSLVGVVKDSLHNPRSFEHVDTSVTSVGNTPAVRMQYRAENGFGATRTGAVNAFISLDDCSVIAVNSSDGS